MAARKLSVGEYVTVVLRRAVEDDHGDDQPVGQERWLQLSAGSFARDWASDEDAAYDQLPSR